MATVIKETNTDLLVEEQYKKLMKASTEDDSVYLKMKDTITQFVTDTTLNDRERADIISTTLTNITGQLSATSMTAAIQIATENRDAPFALTKARVDTELADSQRKNSEQEYKILQLKEKEVQAGIDTAVIGGWNTQANMYRDTGFNASNLSTSTVILPHTGSKEDSGIKLQQYKASQADTYAKFAGAIQNNGYVQYSLGVNGLPVGVLSEDGMVAEQTRVAKRQRFAFDDNMRQHVLNSSASMLGVMIGSEAFESAAAYTPHLLKWDEAADFLNTTRALETGARPAGIIDILPVIVYTVGVNTSAIAVAGTTANVNDGTSVIIKILAANTVYASVGSVLTNAWSGSIPIGKLEDIELETVAGTYDVIFEVSIIDQRERRVYDRQSFSYTV